MRSTFTKAKVNNFTLTHQFFMGTESLFIEFHFNHKYQTFIFKEIHNNDNNNC